MTTTPPTLFPHQREGSLWLCRTTRGGLFDEQGLGKTATAIHAADTLGLQRVLVLAPTVVAHNWRREIERWATGGTVQVVTSSRQKIDPSTRWVVCTHGLLIRAHVQDQLLAGPCWRQLGEKAWDVVILDEAHFFRTPTAQRTRMFYGFASRVGAPNLCRQSARVWLLTGTPMPNNPSELWAMLAGLAPERIRLPGSTPMSWKQFRERFCKLQPSPYGDGWKIVGAQNVAELRERMRGFALRRMAADHLQLPPLRWGTVAVSPERVPEELQELEVALGRPATDDVDAWLDTIREHEDFARYRRLCGAAKAACAVELLAQDLASDATAKVVVFAHHRDVVDHLRTHLAIYSPVAITGDTSAAARQSAVDAFQANPAVRVAVCQLVAGGVGVTLTAATQVVFVELSFVPADNDQAVRRVYRIGQGKPVLARVLTLPRSVDEVLAEALTRKTAMIGEVLGK